MKKITIITVIIILGVIIFVLYYFSTKNYSEKSQTFENREETQPKYKTEQPVSKTIIKKKLPPDSDQIQNNNTEEKTEKAKDKPDPDNLPIHGL